MQIRKRIKTAKPETLFEKDLERELHSAWLELATLLNGGLTIGDNFNNSKVAVTDTGTADTEFTVTHGLKRIPEGFIVIKKDKATDVYLSTTTSTVSNLYLKSTAANAAITVIVF